MWRWSDDTSQAAVLVRELAEGGGDVDQDRLALRIAARMPAHTSVRHAANVLGSGYRVSGPVTAPYALWRAAGHLDDLHEGLWTTVAGRGDIDTICAIAGGVIAARTGTGALPPTWHAAREPLPPLTSQQEE
ncbi:ADP-ribosylglycohydrolase family protein [Streptomyces sp. NPDC004266]|uniref:ADP-ribosylglycohydrolase family protein n=1 Tax=Streptomyces sp. NPDC004266 TaxID=3364693 RepID=UPI00369D48AA